MPEITYLEGYVRINGEEAQVGQEVPIDSQVRTGAESFCTIVFADKNIFRIEPNTLTRISISREQSSIDMSRGSIDAIFERLQDLSLKDEFRFTTPTTVAGVRGTVFYIKVEDPATTYVCTCHGTLHHHGVDEEREQGKEVTSYHHEAYRYVSTDEKTLRESAPLLYHDDEAMDAVASEIDVDIPWGRPE